MKRRAGYCGFRVLQKRSRLDEAVRFYTAACSIRPETAHQLAHALDLRGDSDEALAVFRQNEAVCRAAIRINSDYAELHCRLACDLVRQGMLDEAYAEYREVERLDPKWPGIVIPLPSFVIILERAIRHKPDHAAKAELRREVLGWLKAQDDVGSKRPIGDDAKAHTEAGKTLQYWKLDTNLAGIRARAVLAQLPESERRQGQLWAEIETLFKRAERSPRDSRSEPRLTRSGNLLNGRFGP